MIYKIKNLKDYQKNLYAGIASVFIVFLFLVLNWNTNYWHDSEQYYESSHWFIEGILRLLFNFQLSSLV